MTRLPHDSVPGLSAQTSAEVADVLADRLVGTIDLQLVLKHIHWNVVGPSFKSVHEMLDDQVAAVRDMSDAIAERIATLGSVPNGNAGHLVERRTWPDYPLGRDSVFVHLEELDKAYAGVIADHRQGVATAAGLDPVTEGLLIDQTAKLEMFQWFVRSFSDRARQDGSGIDVTKNVRQMTPATTG